MLVAEQGRCEAIRLDVVLPVLHGRTGEDGAVQGLLELSGIPYVGCDVASSALCMDKALAYVVAQGAGIATPRFWTVGPGEDADPADLPYPVFVKPARSLSPIFDVCSCRLRGRPGAPSPCCSPPPPRAGRG